MNVKQAIRNVINEAKCQVDAERDGDDSIARMRRRCVNLMLEPIDRWADMAEAAIAYVEYQTNDRSDTGRDGATYIRERGKLWDRFMEARRKAKEACNSPAGEGET